MPLLITDLDNTLYDWVSYYARAFRAMVEKLAEALDVEEETLLDEFKAIHQHYGNSEHPFAALELPSVEARFGALSRTQRMRALDGPLGAFRAAREQYLELYPSVRETLGRLHRHGVVIVGHTEATAEQAFFRLRKLGIVGLFRHLYALDGSLKDHPDPARRADLRPPSGLVTSIPRQERKPNPELLRDICRKEGVALGEAYYVGDSLTRDMSMARRAGVAALWARYGTRYDPHLWNILVRITHWTDEDVRREAQLKKRYHDVQPDYVLDRFADILDIVGLATEEVA